MSSKASKKEMGKQSLAKKKRQGLSKWEIIAIPIIIIVAIWSVYSFTQSPTSSSSLTNSVSTTISQSGLAPDLNVPLPVVCSSTSNCPSGLTGQSLTLASLKGKVVLLEFMEPWCPHCQHMAPVLESLYAQYGKQNVVFVSVAGPWNGATASDAANFISQYGGSSWYYVYDSSGTIFSDYGVNSTPTFFILSPNGSVVTTLNGEQTADALSGALTEAGAT